jgi:hypothetical protein
MESYSRNTSSNTICLLEFQREKVSSVKGYYCISHPCLEDMMTSALHSVSLNPFVKLHIVLRQHSLFYNLL